MKARIRMAAAACGLLLSTSVLSANDPVLEWNAIMISTTAGQNPIVQARFATITQLAVFEAVNAIDQDFDPYLGTVVAPTTASASTARSFARASWERAATSASPSAAASSTGRRAG